jgi:hypothetical protein
MQGLFSQYNISPGDRILIASNRKAKKEFTLQALRTSFSGSIIVSGPRPQFNPTTPAPASSNRLQASSTGIPSCIIIVMGTDSVITAGKPVQDMCISLVQAVRNIFKERIVNVN